MLTLHHADSPGWSALSECSCFIKSDRVSPEDWVMQLISVLPKITQKESRDRPVMYFDITYMEERMSEERKKY